MRAVAAATTLARMDLPYPIRLRPGYVAVRRDKCSLQVGLVAPARVVLPDSVEVRRLLADLAQGLAGTPKAPDARGALAALHDADLLEPVRPTAPTRPAAEVWVEAPEQVRSALAPLLRTAGLGVDENAVVTVVADDVPVARDRLDPLLRAGRPHLVVSGSPRDWTVGPFVVPGVTACLRCVDAHLAHRDPRWPIVVDQLARVPRPAQAIDPLTRLTALCLAVADLREYADGRVPATWSATYTVGGGAPTRHDWTRHPHCGCAWDLLAATV